MEDDDSLYVDDSEIVEGEDDDESHDDTEAKPSLKPNVKRKPKPITYKGKPKKAKTRATQRSKAKLRAELQLLGEHAASLHAISDSIANGREHATPRAAPVQLQVLHHVRGRLSRHHDNLPGPQADPGRRRVALQRPRADVQLRGL